MHAGRLEKDRSDLEMEIEDVVLELEHTLRQRVLTCSGVCLTSAIDRVVPQPCF